MRKEIAVLTCLSLSVVVTFAASRKVDFEQDVVGQPPKGSPSDTRAR